MALALALLSTALGFFIHGSQSADLFKRCERLFKPQTFYDVFISLYAQLPELQSPTKQRENSLLNLGGKTQNTPKRNVRPSA